MNTRILDHQVEELVLGFVVAADLAGRDETIVELIATHAARTGPEMSTKPTVGQLLDAVARLLKSGRIVDTYAPGKSGSRHYLKLPISNGLIGLFE